MVNDNNKPEPNQDNSSFEIGKRSITGTKGQTRFEILETNKSKSIFLRPFFYIGFSFFIILFFYFSFLLCQQICHSTNAGCSQSS